MASTTSITSWMVSKYPPGLLLSSPPGLRHEGPKTKQQFMARSAKPEKDPYGEELKK